jgi:hypothetical protein
MTGSSGTTTQGRRLYGSEPAQPTGNRVNAPHRARRWSLYGSNDQTSRGNPRAASSSTGSSTSDECLLADERESTLSFRSERDHDRRLLLRFEDVDADRCVLDALQRLPHELAVGPRPEELFRAGPLTAARRARRSPGSAVLNAIPEFTPLLRVVREASASVI